MYLKQFINGKEGAEFATLLNKIDQAFGRDAVGGSIGMETKEQLLGTLGVNFIRENKVDIVEAVGIEAQKKAAAGALKQIGILEKTLTKRVGGAEAKQAMKQLFQQDSMKEYKKLLNQVATGTPDSSAKATQQLGLIMSFKEAEDFVTTTAQLGSNLSKADLDDVITNLRSLDALDKRSGDFYRDLVFSENWGTVINAMAKPTSVEKNAAIKGWADDWISARSKPNGVENMTELFGKEMYQGMDDLALNIRGALNIDPNAGALSVAEVPLTIFKSLLRLDFQGAIKPLSFIFGTKQFAPGTDTYKKLNNSIEKGIAQEKIIKDSSAIGEKALAAAQKSANGVMAGRNGLFAASVSSYLNEADQTYPTEDEVPAVAPKKIEEMAPAAPEQQGMVPTDTGLAAIQQIASMIQGVGTSGLEEGADIARSAA